MKKSEVKGAKLLALFFIIIFSLSIVSAGFFGDLFKSLFPGLSKTGQVIDDSGSCTDYDGANSYFSASKVRKDGTDYFDYCDTNIAYDYYCGVAEAGSEAQIAASLPVLDRITGRVTDLGPPPKTSVNCQSSYGLTCIGGGQCGCVEGTSATCGETDVGECTYGTTTCIGGSYDECSAVLPISETCNGKDDDCDGTTDDGNLCPSGQTCDSISSKRCVTSFQQLDIDQDGYSTPSDCNDDNPNINPGKTEICTDGVDNNCNGKTDSQDLLVCGEDPNSCTPNCSGKTCGNDGCGGQCGTCSSGNTCISNQCVAQCTDNDHDGYGATSTTACQFSGIDCNDASSSVNINADELCDGVDNNCVGGVDENVGATQEKCIQNDGTYVQKTLSCSNGITQTCTSLGLTACSNAEICADEIDNNCDGSIDEGCSCINGETQVCNTGDVCEIGEQTCSSGKWGDCKAKETLTNCNVETACSPDSEDVCGTNLGTCVIGTKICGSDGLWESCSGGIQPVDEICDNGLDDDCNGYTDKDDDNCASIDSQNSDSSSSDTETINGQTSTNENNQNEGGDSSGSSSSSSEEKQSFLRKLIDILLKILRVGQVLISGKITDTPAVHCSDSDGGINYFQKGTGNGLNVDKIEVWFNDFCYKGTQNTKAEKCTGSGCFLKEYSCKDNTVNSEAQVVCKFGCYNGACIPDSSLSDDCRYFDKEKWEWVNRC